MQAFPSFGFPRGTRQPGSAVVFRDNSVTLHRTLDNRFRPGVRRCKRSELRSVGGGKRGLGKAGFEQYVAGGDQLQSRVVERHGQTVGLQGWAAVAGNAHFQEAITALHENTFRLQSTSLAEAATVVRGGASAAETWVGQVRGLRTRVQAGVAFLSRIQAAVRRVPGFVFAPGRLSGAAGEHVRFR